MPDVWVGILTVSNIATAGAFLYKVWRDKVADTRGDRADVVGALRGQVEDLKAEKRQLAADLRATRRAHHDRMNTLMVDMNGVLDRLGNCEAEKARLAERCRHLSGEHPPLPPDSGS